MRHNVNYSIPFKVKFHEISGVKLSPQNIEVSIQRCVEEMDPPGSTFSPFLPWHAGQITLVSQTLSSHQQHWNRNPKPGLQLRFTELTAKRGKKA